MLALLVSLALAAAPVDPQQGGSLGENWSPHTGEVRRGVHAGTLIPLDQAIAAVQRRVPGHLLDAGAEDGGAGHKVYRLRWAAADGRRMDVIVDGESGAVLRQEGK